MTDPQWNDLLQVIRGELLEPLPVGLIVDSPWLPGWAGVAMLDYFADDHRWLQTNLKVVRQFPNILVLPGFWAEYGMCTEPSAFGAKCVWQENAFPSVEKSLHDYAEALRVKKPNCRTDGLLPFVIRRLLRARAAIEAAGHRIRFATARGPLNIASHLLGHSEFLVGIKTHPQETHRLLTVITDFLVDWIGCQADALDSINGIFLLDDLIGFLRDDDFQQFALPYLKRIYDARDVQVRFLHNDAFGLVTARHLAALGVNLFNFSFQHSMPEMRAAAGPSVVLAGNIPPRDVFAQGSPAETRQCTAAMLSSLEDHRRIIVSCGGGVPPDVPSENLNALCSAVAEAQPITSRRPA
jgi:uroporphyrinogen decarboxylase